IKIDDQLAAFEIAQLDVATVLVLGAGVRYLRTRFEHYASFGSVTVVPAAPASPFCERTDLNCESGTRNRTRSKGSVSSNASMWRNAPCRQTPSGMQSSAGGASGSS